MRTNNRGVLRAWSQGQEAHSNNSNLTTDGADLFSYGLKIGVNLHGQCIVGDFTSPGGHFASMTGRRGLPMMFGTPRRFSIRSKTK